MASPASQLETAICPHASYLTRSTDQPERNRNVELCFRELFGAPAAGVCETVILRHLGSASARDERGTLYHRGSCFVVLSGARDRGLDKIVPPVRGSAGQRLQSLFLRAKGDTNISLGALFPPMALRMWSTGVAGGATSGDLHPSFPERQPGTPTSTAPTCASIGRVWRQRRRHWHLLRRGSFCTKDALSPCLSAGRPVGRCSSILIS